MLSSYSIVILKVVLIAFVVQSALMQGNEDIGVNPVGQVDGQDQIPQIHPRNQLIRKKRGFGCGGPFSKDEQQCHNHCKTIPGVYSFVSSTFINFNLIRQYKGGYCDSAKGWFVCKCY